MAINALPFQDIENYWRQIRALYDSFEETFKERLNTYDGSYDFSIENITSGAQTYKDADDPE